MKLNKITAITLAAFLGAAALNAKVVDSTVATVNGKPILNSEYEKVSQATLENYKNREPAVLANKDNVTAIKEEGKRQRSQRKHSGNQETFSKGRFRQRFDRKRSPESF